VEFLFLCICPVKYATKVHLHAQLRLEIFDPCRREEMNNMCTRKSCSTASLLVAAVMLFVLSGAKAQVPSPDEGADDVFKDIGEGTVVTGTHHIGSAMHF
jgi:hypothetical protein